MTYSGADLILLKDYLVYAWKRGEDWLYIGTTTNVSRVFRHNIIDAAEKVLPTDQILLWSGFSDWYEADHFAVSLTLEVKPKYSVILPHKDNRTLSEQECPICKKRFMPRRWWQRFCSTRCRSGSPRSS